MDFIIRKYHFPYFWSIIWIFSLLLWSFFRTFKQIYYGSLFMTYIFLLKVGSLNELSIYFKFVFVNIIKILSFSFNSFYVYNFDSIDFLTIAIWGKYTFLYYQSKSFSSIFASHSASYYANYWFSQFTKLAYFFGVKS